MEEIGKPLTNDRTAIVLAARKMLHAEKVKPGGRGWWHAAYNIANRAIEEFTAAGATEADKDKAFRELEKQLSVITGLPRAH